MTTRDAKASSDSSLPLETTRPDACRHGSPSCEDCRTLFRPLWDAMRQRQIPRSGLEQLIDKWRTNADMLSEGNKDLYFSEGAGMQRACAADLETFLRSDVAARESMTTWFPCPHCGSGTTPLLESVDDGTTLTCSSCGKKTVVSLSGIDPASPGR